MTTKQDDYSVTIDFPLTPSLTLQIVSAGVPGEKHKVHLIGPDAPAYKLISWKIDSDFAGGHDGTATYRRVHVLLKPASGATVDSYTEIHNSYWERP